MLSFSDNKDLYARTEGVKDSKVISNVKMSYNKIRIGFNSVEESLALPKNMVTAVKNILREQFFGDRCKLKDY